MSRPIHLAIVSLLAITLAPFAGAKESDEIPLTARGQELQKKYAKELESLRAEVVAAMPPIDATKKARFLEVRAKWNGLASPNKDNHQSKFLALFKGVSTIIAPVAGAEKEGTR